MKRIYVYIVLGLLVISCNNNSYLNYYKEHSEITDPGKYGYMYKNLPSNIYDITKSIQGLILHVAFIKPNGIDSLEKDKIGFSLRKMEDILEKIHHIDSSGILVEREPKDRLIVFCRHYAVFLCSVLRHKGLPARVRVGYATYLRPGLYENHWICEYWDFERERWIQVDAQIDTLQREIMDIGFNTLELPPGEFIPAGLAWQMCRNNEEFPEKFGVGDRNKFNIGGFDFIINDVFCDLRALNKDELLPSDGNLNIKKKYTDYNENEIELIDKISQLTMNIDNSFSQIRELYSSDNRCRLPEDFDCENTLTGEN